VSTINVATDRNDATDPLRGRASRRTRNFTSGPFVSLGGRTMVQSKGVEHRALDGIQALQQQQKGHRQEFVSLNCIDGIAPEFENQRFW